PSYASLPSFRVDPPSRAFTCNVVPEYRSHQRRLHGLWKSIFTSDLAILQSTIWSGLLAFTQLARFSLGRPPDWCTSNKSMTPYPVSRGAQDVTNVTVPLRGEFSNSLARATKDHGKTDNEPAACDKRHRTGQQQ